MHKKVRTLLLIGILAALLYFTYILLNPRSATCGPTVKLFDLEQEINSSEDAARVWKELKNNEQLQKNFGKEMHFSKNESITSLERYTLYPPKKDLLNRRLYTVYNEPLRYSIYLDQKGEVYLTGFCPGGV